MNAPPLQGIWTHPSLGFPDQDEFISIDEVRGRIICFVVISVTPVTHAPMRIWYHAMSATSITARLRPTDPWRGIHEFQFEGERLMWTYAGGTHDAWRRLSPTEQPDWFDARLAAENSRMDVSEQSAFFT